MNEERFQQLFSTEQPYLEQSLSWREGMRYRYSPERYPVTLEQFTKMRDCGRLVGELLNQRFGQYSVIEFRLDYVADISGDIFVTEIQTDDRGLPAVANERNARGFTSQEQLVGVVPAFLEALKLATQTDQPTLLITYPAKEKFYYNGFYDVARMCFAAQAGPQVVVAQQENILSQPSNIIRIKIPREGLTLTLNPDAIWNFGSYQTPNFKQIQPLIDKSLLETIWSQEQPLNQALRQYIPQTITPNGNPPAPKDSWIIKPVFGRWSRGVTIGKRVEQSTWIKECQTQTPIIAQRFINPRIDLFETRNKNGRFSLARMYSRLEGYYCATDTGWTLADVLVTATPDYPVHGKKDCIMTLAQVIE